MDGSELARVAEIDRTERIDVLHDQHGEQLEELARVAGDASMVVSATPSGNTVRFYLSRGFVPTAEPLAELVELEPEDVHMHKAI